MAKLTKNRSQSSREISDHITGETSVTEVDAVASPVKDVQWDVKEGEVHSDIRLEDDIGEGNPIIVRSFDFSANPEAFNKRTPSGQELFSAHASQIEILLMKDGFKVFEGVNPQVKISKNKKFYRISVGAELRKGVQLSYSDTAKTLSELAHDTRTNRK